MKAVTKRAVTKRAVTVAAAAVATAVTTTSKAVKKTQFELSPPTPRATPFFKRDPMTDQQGANAPKYRVKFKKKQRD